MLRRMLINMVGAGLGIIVTALVWNVVLFMLF